MVLRVFCSTHTTPGKGGEPVSGILRPIDHIMLHTGFKKKTLLLPQMAQPQPALRESRPQELRCSFKKSNPTGVSGHTHAALCRSDIADTMCEARFSSCVSTGKSLTCTADLSYIFCIYSARMRRGVLHVAWVWNMHRGCHHVNKRSALLIVKEDFVLML